MGKTVLDATVVNIEKRRVPSKHYVRTIIYNKHYFLHMHTFVYILYCRSIIYILSMPAGVCQSYYHR